VIHHTLLAWLARYNAGAVSRRTPMSAKDAGRGLTAGAFSSLLTRLAPDAERAGSAYEHLRRALVSFFAWRGAATPEECADETLDRLGKRLEGGAVVEDLPGFARGIARLVLLEHWRRPDARGVPLDVGSPPRVTAESAPDDALADCLDHCLGELPHDGRDLILGYYRAEGRNRIDARKRMAQALGVSESALRNRAQRLRDQLARCVTDCAGSPAGAPSAPRRDTKL
jgi:DNA-directed RNA polymerase specialized sigma24 family protein